MTNEYDLIAPFYDVEHAHFTEDVSLYRDFAAIHGGPLLELACGSGRLLVPLAQDGYVVTGVDSSAQMLALAYVHIHEAGVAEQCTLVEQDITTLQLGHTFRMAFVALGSFAHITTRKQQQQALKAIHAHLAPGGLCILDISNADVRYLEDMSGQVLHQGTWQREDGTLLTHFLSPTASTTQHRLELTHFYDQHKQGEAVQRTVATSYLYLFERSEMELLLEQAGFAVKHVYGDYELSPYEHESPRMIIIAEAH